MKIYGPKTDGVTGSGIYYITRSFIVCIHGQVLFERSYHKNGMGGACGQVHAGPGRKRPLGRPRQRWEDNIKMDLEEMGQGGMDWIDLAQDRDR